MIRPAGCFQKIERECALPAIPEGYWPFDDWGIIGIDLDVLTFLTIDPKSALSEELGEAIDPFHFGGGERCLSFETFEDLGVL